MHSCWAAKNRTFCTRIRTDGRRRSPDDARAGRGSWRRSSREMSVVLACCCSSFQRGALPADGSASKYSIAKFDLNTICVPEAYAFSPRPRLNEWTFHAHFYAPAFSKAPCGKLCIGRYLHRVLQQGLYVNGWERSGRDKNRIYVIVDFICSVRDGRAP